MRARWFTLAALLAAWSPSAARAADPPAAGPDRSRLIGAWHMVSMEEQARDGSLSHHADRVAMLVYTADGHMYVQVMYPPSEIASTANSPYAQAGFESSFGSYDVDEAAHVVIFHVQGALVRTLVGRDLPRAMRFSPDGHLTLRSTHPDETWSVTWEHD